MTNRSGTFAAIAIGAVVSFPSFAGDLTPPAGPVAPTMKTLVEVEPRTVINPTNTPGDADSVFRIASSGSYYLVGNVSVPTGKSGIEIAANDVTIDLNGFAIRGISLLSLHGITGESAGLQNTRISNGVIRGVGMRGIYLDESRSGRLDNVRVSDCMDSGFRFGSDFVISDCVAIGNGINGFSAEDGHAVFERCAASENDQTGILGGSYSTLSGCVAQLNGSNGISVSFGSIVRGCVSESNGNHGFSAIASVLVECSALLNTSNGYLLTNTAVANCIAYSQFGNGMAASGGCYLLNNVCEVNGLVAGAGILVTGRANRIEGNVSANADVGIDIDGTGNLILRNAAEGNNINYSIVASNRYGPIIDVTALGAAPANGNAAPGTLLTSDPWANFAY